MLKPLSPETVAQLISQGAWAIDMRDFQEFKSGHLPDSATTPLHSPQFSMLMKMTPKDRLIVLVLDGASDIALIERRLAKIGQFTIAGYLEGGIAAWRASGHPIKISQ